MARPTEQVKSSIVSQHKTIDYPSFIAEANSVLEAHIRMVSVTPTTKATIGL